MVPWAAAPPAPPADAASTWADCLPAPTADLFTAVDITCPEMSVACNARCPRETLPSQQHTAPATKSTMWRRRGDFEWLGGAEGPGRRYEQPGSPPAR